LKMNRIVPAPITDVKSIGPFFVVGTFLWFTFLTTFHPGNLSEEAKRKSRYIRTVKESVHLPFTPEYSSPKKEE